MATTEKVIVVDVKAVEPIYPDAENIKPVIESIKRLLKTDYERLRLAESSQLAYDDIERTRRGLPKRSTAAGYVEPFEYPEYDEAITFDATFSTGNSINGVITVALTITLTIAEDYAYVVNLLNKINIAGTFAINPTNRVTGY